MALISADTRALSQTDFNILSESENLVSEFQKELDKWMLRAYEGDRDAQFKVGVLFANDQFGPPDNEQAAYWYNQAARQGHVLSQYNLGHQYLTGAGVKRDEKTAMQWWLKAAQQQHALAQFNVGRAYYLGIGLNKDLQQAKLWFERASQNNEPKSTELLKQLGWWDQNSVASVEQPGTTTSASTSIANTTTNTSNLEPAPLTSPALLSKIEPVSEAAINNDAADITAVETQVRRSTDRPEVKPQQAKQPLAVFTNPAIRHVLITIVDDFKQLNIVEKSNSWTKVNYNKGFPVWVHKNFIRVNASQGSITASSVNARSVPLITQGSVIGRFDNGERVSVIDSKGDWYRVRSPKRFVGWVKTEELLALTDLRNEQRAISKKENTGDKETEVRRQTIVTQTISEPRLTGNAPSPKRTIEEDVNESSGLKTSKKLDTVAHADALKSIQPSLNDNAWLFSQDEDLYTLQLASFSYVESIKRYVEGLSFEGSDELHLFSTESDERVEWTYIIYGTYTSKKNARAGRVKLNKKRAWIRKLGILQQNRCIAWKKQLPAPKELNEYCT